MTNNDVLHPLENLFSQRSAHIKQSAVRDVFDISVRPGLISLAGGSPSLENLPRPELAEIARKVISERGTEALNYGAGNGTSELRQAITEVMAFEGAEGIDPERVVVTTGSQSAQDVAAKVFCDPGDVILCEDPTYVGALNAFEVYQTEVVPVPTDEQGIIASELERVIRELKQQGRSIKMLYTIPSFNNPSGITLSAQRRPEIVRICKESTILILEDNPYGLLAFDGKPLKPLVADYPEDVIYLGSFSKILAPGVRVGWAVIPKALYRRFYLAAEAVVLCPSTLTQLIVSEYLSTVDWQAVVRASREIYAERAQAMLKGLEEHFGHIEGVTWTVPSGGFFIWLTLPEGIDTYPLMMKAIDAGVVFIPGEAFSPAEGPDHHLRLAFSGISPEDIAEGLDRLAPVLLEALASS